MEQRIEHELTSYLTVQDLVQMFGRTGMTVHNWRKHRGLPTVVIPGHARSTLRFRLHDVMAWARDNDIRIARMPALKGGAIAA
jgi:hypothetical protein